VQAVACCGYASFKKYEGHTMARPVKIKAPAPELIALNKWLAASGISRMTGWRWRKDGILKTTIIYGRHYVSHEAIAEMQRRAKAGEFTTRKASHA
jgi:hypothetical protein